MDEDFRKIKTFSIFGAGNLGMNLLAALRRAGYSLKSIYRRAKYPGFDSFITPDIGEAVSEAQIILISTGESAIRSLAREIAATGYAKGKFVFHTSGFLSSDELGEIRRRGGYTAAFSPLQTFPDFDRKKDPFRGIRFIGEGDDRALDLAGEIAGRLGGSLLRLGKREKMRVHIAAVIASNFLVSLFRFSQSQLNRAGKDQSIEILMPLIRQTLKNIEEKGLDKALSGPVARGETGLVDKHLELLEGDDRKLYSLLSDLLWPGADNSPE